jgi:methylenetetrahydrofolate dehydrogenase (NADP+)/methenyltetrahydrofolate cyclohydrolase
MYIRMKHRACEQVGIGSVGLEIAGDTTTDEVVKGVTRLNNDPDIDGILIQLPLPKQVDTEQVIASVSVDKDVDGFHPFNLGLLFSGKPRFVPCTPKGILTMLLITRCMADAMPATKALPPIIEFKIKIAKIGEIKPHPV